MEPGKKINLTRIQKLIGSVMLQATQEKPFCYLQCSADVTELVRLRKSCCKAGGVRITTNDFCLCAIATAIKDFPLMAGAIDAAGDYLEIAERIGVGIAVAAPHGLVVPVIQDVAHKSLVEIAAENDRLLKKARSNKLTPDDFYGANVVLTALGMYGVTSFFAIAPPSASGIVSIGTVNDTVVPHNDNFAVRKMMSVSLAFDRRIADELYAAKFLSSVAAKLQDPVRLMS